MAHPTDPPADPAGRSSDQQWLDRLSGLPGPYTDDEAVREADALRLAIQLDAQALAADPDLAAATSPQGIARRKQRLREHLGAAPAPAPAPPPVAIPPTGWPRWQAAWRRVRQRVWPPIEGGSAPWQRWPAAAGLAAVLALTAVVVQQQWWAEPPYGDGEPPGDRGGVGVQHRRVAQPRQAAEAFAQALRNAGLKPALYRRGKTYLVDITLDATELEAATPAFSPLALEPVPGFTRLEFDAP